jgi:hypothetical protein
MKRLVPTLVLAAFSIGLAFCLATPGLAQTKKTSEKRTVTGCLQKGEEADEFSITGEDGKRYDLTSSAVNLSKHLGHRVTVTGTFKAESAEKEEQEKEEYGKKGGGSEAGDIRVETLKMVSDKCQ